MPRRRILTDNGRIVVGSLIAAFFFLAICMLYAVAC